MNVTVHARHMEATEALRQYVQSKVVKLPRFYDNVMTIEVILEMDADQPKVEMIAHARRRRTFVAKNRGENMYACVDQCLDKITGQLRRHKDRVRDRQGPPRGGRASAPTE